MKQIEIKTQLNQLQGTLSLMRQELGEMIQAGAPDNEVIEQCESLTRLAHCMEIIAIVYGD